MAETYTGHIQNGVVVLDAGAPPWPEGTRLQIVPIEGPARSTTLAERYADIIGIAEGLPADLAMEHDHYIHGTPRRSET